MRARSMVPALLVLAMPFTVFAGDGDKPAPAAKPATAKAAAEKAAKDKKPAEAPAAVPASLVRPAPRSLDEALRRLANVRVSVKFSDTPFVDVVEYIRRVAGFNVIVSPILQNKGLDAIRPITMTLNDVSLRQLTELVGQFSSTKFKLSDGVLQFTTPQDARGNPIRCLVQAVLRREVVGKHQRGRGLRTRRPEVRAGRDGRRTRQHSPS